MSVWLTRDARVLRHLADNPPQHSILWTESRSRQPHPELQGISGIEFHRAVLTLADAGYVSWGREEGEGGGGWNFQDFQVTGAGMQALGLWPRFDALGSPGELADLLDALGRDAATEEERSNFRRAAQSVRRTAPEVVRSLLVGGLAAWTRARLGI